MWDGAICCDATCLVGLRCWLAVLSCNMQLYTLTAVRKIRRRMKRGRRKHENSKKHNKGKEDEEVEKKKTNEE